MFKKNSWITLIAGTLILAFLQIVIPRPENVNYIFMFYGAFVVFVASGAGYKIHMLSAIFIGCIVLSIMFNKIPPLFKPWQRFTLFFLLMLACSPLIQGEGINRVRRHIMMGTMWGLAVLVLWSMAAYIMGTGLYITGGINGYMGVTMHPNFLGFFGFMVATWAAALFFRCTNNKERIIIGGAWGCSMVVLMLSASRSSLACAVLGTMAATYLRYRKNASALMTAAGLVVAGVVLAMPYLAPFLETMNKKNQNYDTKEEALMATRGAIWDLRFQEIDKSPIFGVGAYACDVTLPNAEVFYDMKNGSIEQGNSYLGLWAQVGFLGFATFLLILVSVMWKAWKFATKQQTPYAQLMFSLLVPVAAHMIFEGYAITAGAIQCVVMWLLLGCADQCDTVADYPVFWEKNDPPTPEQYVAWKEYEKEYGAMNNED